MTGHEQQRAASVILVGGHESHGGRDLPAPARLVALGGTAGAPLTVTAPGRDLERALDAALRTRDPGRPVVVVPMTLGRDPRLVSDTARTVRWAARSAGPGALALAPPFGTGDHLVSHLRTACRRIDDPATAILVVAPAADPFDDAELHRVAALVRTHAPHAMVEVGLRRPEGDPDEGRRRCRRLGATEVAVIPATFGVPSDADGPLLSTPAIAALVAARVRTALHRLADHGDDGVATAHDADHHHGFAHSHDHDHDHDPGHAHTHGSGASHDHDHPDPHAHDHLAVG